MAPAAAARKEPAKTGPKTTSKVGPAPAEPTRSPTAATPTMAVSVTATASEPAATPAKSNLCNVIADTAASLQRFDLLDLQPYTQEKVFATSASKDFHLFYVGRDDVHDILKHVLSRVSVSLYLNMFGFDDEELNDILMTIALDETVTMLVTLDKSQAGGKHEKRLLDADRQHNLALFNTHFVTQPHLHEIVIGQSATHQISHTKGFVADGRVAGEGSTNWSDAGEGTFIVKGAPGGPGFKAQNNTQSIITDPDTISRFSAQLVAEHLIAQRQAAGTGLDVTPSQSGKPTQRREPSSARVATASGRRASTAR